MSQEKLEKIDLWIAQATREIELSEPGTDRSQFPLRDLFASIAEKSGDLTGLEEFHKAAKHTAELIETILFSGESYTAGQLETLANLATQLADLRATRRPLCLPPNPRNPGMLPQSLRRSISGFPKPPAKFCSPSPAPTVANFRSGIFSGASRKNPEISRAWRNSTKPPSTPTP